TPLAELSQPTRALVELGQIDAVEKRLGVPTFFWAPQFPDAGSLRDAGVTPEQAARRYLFTYAALYKIAPSAVNELPLTNLHDTGKGAVIATFHSREQGIDLFRDELHVVMNQKLQLIAISGYLNPNGAKVS